MTNVLYISYDGMTDPLGQSQVLPYLADLSEHGFLFTLISFEKKDRFIKNKSKIEKICAAANIDWIPLEYTSKPPVISTLWDYRKMLGTAQKLHKLKRFEIVHCRSYIAALAGLKLKQQYGIRFLFDMRGFWADERIDGGLWKKSHPAYNLIYKYFKNKEREFLEHADAVVSLTNAGKREMLRWQIPGLHSEKISVIPCAADFNLFRPITTESKFLARESLGFKSNDYVVSYIGSVGTWYLLDEMLLFFKIVQQKHPHARFLFLTPDQPSIIEDAAKQADIELSNLVIRYANREELPDYAHAADLNIFFIKPAYSKIASSPTKLGEVLAMGIPVVCNNRVGDVEEIICKTDAGLCLSELDEVSLSKAADYVLEYEDADSLQVREKAKMFFDLKKGSSAYFKIYESLLPWHRDPKTETLKQPEYDLA